MYQKIIIIGRLGQDPVMKNVNGQELCKFSVATTNVWKDQTGTKHEDTTWHNVDVWGKSASSCGQYLRKGSLAMVEGEVQIRQHEGKTYYGIKAYNVRFLSTSKEGMANENSANGTLPPPQQAAQSSAAFTEDDIPF